MSDIKARFDEAVIASKSLPTRPDNQTLLQLYALFKQASAGNVEGRRPGFADLVGRAKYDAWEAIKDTSAEDAMTQYVALVERLQATR
jgi:acyl-CoA-binding protein